MVSKAKKRFLEEGLVHRSGKLVNPIFLLEAKRMVLEKNISSYEKLAEAVVHRSNPVLAKKLRDIIKEMTKKRGIILVKLGDKGEANATIHRLAGGDNDEGGESQIPGDAEGSKEDGCDNAISSELPSLDSGR